MSEQATPLPSTWARFAAELFGTFFLITGLIGTAVNTAAFVGDGTIAVNVGILGVAIAVGFVAVAVVFAVAPVSGAHLNPAVTFGLAAAGRFAWKDVWLYLVAQIAGAIAATSLLWFYFHDRAEVGDPGTFAANGFGEFSPGGYGFWSVAIVETVLTFFLVMVVLNTTAKRAAPGFAAIAIGLTLTVIHLVSIPISNTSVNPARSIATAIYGGTGVLEQLWVFLVFPILGGVIAGVANTVLFNGEKKGAVANSVSAKA